MAKVIRHSIKERSKGWVLNLHYDNNTRRQLSCHSQAHAMERLRDALNGVSDELIGQFTLHDAYEKAKEHYAKLANQKSPISQFEEVMQWFGPAMPVNRISYAAVKKYQDHLLEKVGNSPSTVNAKVAKIRLARDFAVQAGVKSLPPLPKNVPLSFVEKGLWTPDELTVVVRDLSNRGYVKHAHLLLFLYEMGCRHSEAFRLRSRDINLRNGTVHFFKPSPDHKNQNRRLPLTPQAVDVISDYVKKDRNAPVWHFDGDMRISHSRFDGQLRISLERCGIDKRRPVHTLRDTCLSRLGQAGCTAFEIMQWSGHKSVSAVSLYVQMDVSRLNKARDILSATTCQPTVTKPHVADLQQVVCNLQKNRP